MPRYFFNVTGQAAEHDNVGTELSSPQYAKREGAKLIGVLIAEGLLNRHDGGLRLEVTDEGGAVLYGFDLTSWDASLPRAA